MHERAGWITQHARQDKWDSQRSPLARLPCSNSRWRWMREPSLSSNILGVVLLWHGASDHTAAAKMAGIRASVQPTRLVVFNPNSNKDPGPLLMPCTSPAGPLPALRPPPLSRRSAGRAWLKVQAKFCSPPFWSIPNQSVEAGRPVDLIANCAALGRASCPPFPQCDAFLIVSPRRPLSGHLGRHV